MHSFHWVLVNTPVASLYNDGTVSLFARVSYDDDISNKEIRLAGFYFHTSDRFSFFVPQRQYQTRILDSAP